MRALLFGRIERARKRNQILLCDKKKLFNIFLSNRFSNNNKQEINVSLEKYGKFY